MRLYLGKRDIYSRYELGTNKRDWDDQDGFSPTRSYLMAFCGKEFEHYTTILLNGKKITLAPGQLTRVKSIVFEVEEVK